MTDCQATRSALLTGMTLSGVAVVLVGAGGCASRPSSTNPYAGGLQSATVRDPALTRLQLRERRTNDSTTTMLAEIALRGDSPQWRDWARERLATNAQLP
jgi:hypothetical protein